MTDAKTALGPGEVLIREGLFKFPDASCPRPRLVAGRCAACGNIVFPKLDLCPQCSSDRLLEEVELGPRGTIYTYTVARQAFPGFDVPYVIAAVTFPEGVHVLGHVETSDVDAIRIGQEVEVRIGAIKTNMAGDKVISYKFAVVGRNGRS